MAKGNLVVVESAAKARTIEKFLGRQYTVRACLGHVRDLPKSALGVDVERDFTPKGVKDRLKTDKKYFLFQDRGIVLRDLRSITFDHEVERTTGVRVPTQVHLTYVRPGGKETIIVDRPVADLQGFGPYIAQTPGIIRRYGGELLDVIQVKNVVEGTGTRCSPEAEEGCSGQAVWPVGAITGVVRFPNRAAFEAFYASPEYAPMIALRHQYATSDVIVAEALPLPPGP